MQSDINRHAFLGLDGALVLFDEVVLGLGDLELWRLEKGVLCSRRIARSGW